MSWWQWVSVIEVPVFLALLSLVARAIALRDERIEALRQKLVDFQIEVARDYLRSAEFETARREIIEHLVRIEKKIDRQVEN